MNKYILLTGLTAALFACGGKSEYGASFDESKAVAVDAAVKTFKSGGDKQAVVSGNIAAVCQSEGCWFNYKSADGDVRVDFDHKFTIPKDVKGKQAVANGYFYYDTTSVEQLKEWAKDDKKSQEEIDKISQPEITLVFRASGVKLK